MRAAPPVEFAAACGWASVSCQAALHAAAFGVSVFWAAGHLGAGPRTAAAAAAAIASLGALVATRVARQADWGTLRWSGTEWTWRSAAGRPTLAGAVRPVLDLGTMLLIRFLPEGLPGRRAPWLRLSLASDPAAWAALRGALFARPGIAGPPSASP